MRTLNNMTLADLFNAANANASTPASAPRSFGHAYENAPGKGALFGAADPASGEIVISGRWLSPCARFDIELSGRLADDGQTIVLTGTVAGHPRLQVVGELAPASYGDDGEYKNGFVSVVGPQNTMTWSLNSKTATSKAGKPYRFVWFTRGDSVKI